MGTKRDKKKKKRDPTVTAKNKFKKKEEEEDVEELIQEFKDSINQDLGIFPCQAPCRRANASMITCPTTFNIYFFGGEFYNGRKTLMFNDFYSFIIDKNEWKKINCLESPGPRSSQQMVAFPNGYIYLLYLI